MPRAAEQDLVAALTTFDGYRLARWRAVILHGMAGIGKTTIAQTLTDDGTIARAFRDGIAWADGSRDPEEEVTRLCLGFRLEREPGEQWVECWRRWAGAGERRLLVIIDDAVSAEGLPPIIAGLGPQVAALITTQQGAEIRAEVERWLPANAIMEVGVRGLMPTKGRALVEAAIAQSLTDAEWSIVQEIGELLGWHPEALRLAAIEGREIGWQEMRSELRIGCMPWDEVTRLVMRQLARLGSDHQAWLMTLIQRIEPGCGFTPDEAAQYWKTGPAVATRRLWRLERCGLVVWEDISGAGSPRLRVEPTASLVLRGHLQPHEKKRRDGQ